MSLIGGLTKCLHMFQAAAAAATVAESSPVPIAAEPVEDVANVVMNSAEPAPKSREATPPAKIDVSVPPGFTKSEKPAVSLEGLLPSGVSIEPERTIETESQKAPEIETQETNNKIAQVEIRVEKPSENVVEKNEAQDYVQKTDEDSEEMSTKIEDAEPVINKDKIELKYKYREGKKKSHPQDSQNLISFLLPVILLTGGVCYLS